jgi:hypothetical protein
MYVAAVLAQGVIMFGFSDEELDGLTALARALPPRSRGDFLRAVASKLTDQPNEMRGPGLVHRLAREVQVAFLEMSRPACRQNAGGDEQSSSCELCFKAPLERTRTKTTCQSRAR